MKTFLCFKGHQENVKTKKKGGGSSHCGRVKTDLTRNHEVAGSIPDLAQWVEDLALP